MQAILGRDVIHGRFQIYVGQQLATEEARLLDAFKAGAAGSRWRLGRARCGFGICARIGVCGCHVFLSVLVRYAGNYENSDPVAMKAVCLTGELGNWVI
jgi:hypothetical protein